MTQVVSVTCWLAAYAYVLHQECVWCAPLLGGAALGEWRGAGCGLQPCRPLHRRFAGRLL